MSDFYDIPVVLLNGKTLNLESLKNKVVLVVNIASKCGFTKQLDGLQNLYEKYHKKGLEIIAFPSNDFKQEPKEAVELGVFCQKNYGVTFPVAQKVSVRGKNKHPLFQFFLDNKGSSVKWNFYKFLIDRSGNLVQSFSSLSKPEGGSLEKEVQVQISSS